jgi:hypothetical protein
LLVQEEQRLLLLQYSFVRLGGSRPRHFEIYDTLQFVH